MKRPWLTLALLGLCIANGMAIEPFKSADRAVKKGIAMDCDYPSPPAPPNFE